MEICPSSLTVLVLAIAFVAACQGQEACGNGTHTWQCENDGRCYENRCVCMDGWAGRDCNTTVRCGQFPVEHAVVILEEPGEGYTGAYNEIITYTCMDGYQFDDAESGSSETRMEKTARCNEVGQWQPTDIPCLALCPALPVWRGYLADTPRRLAGTTIRYICYGRYAWYEPNDDNLKYKYRFVNKKEGDESELSTTCMPNATWWPPIEDCLEIQTKADNYSSSATKMCAAAVIFFFTMLIPLV